jgi:hypothetical protein
MDLPPENPILGRYRLEIELTAVRQVSEKI